MAADQHNLDENEDLFDFDALDGAAPKSSAASKAPAQEHAATIPSAAPGANVRPVAVAPKNLATSGTPSAARTPAPTPEPALPGRTAAPSSDAAAAALARTREILKSIRPGAVELAAGPRDAAPGDSAALAAVAGSEMRAKGRPIGQIALITTAIANLVLAGVVWHAQGSTDAAPAHDANSTTTERPDHGSPDRETNRGTAPGKSAAPVNVPLDAGLPADPRSTRDASEGETALTTAEAEIRRGEYERARARLYSLLSVIDRFDAAQRAGIASRAQVLAADSYREQADALERQSAGFLPAAHDTSRETVPGAANGAANGTAHESVSESKGDHR